MTDSLFGAVQREREPLLIRSVTDRASLTLILEQRRLFAAYALAQLDPEAFPLSAWWTCHTESGLSLVCHSRAGLGDATFVLGPSQGVAAILSLHPGPARTFATAKPEQLKALESAYRLSGARTMRRMHVTAQSFEPVEGDTLRLLGGQVRLLNRLYASEGGPTSYLPHHIEEGCYHGVLAGGRLVAVAGTHSISAVAGIAVVGNVFTHPDHRGRGYATLATSAATADLLRHCRDVVLSVDPENRPAVSAYRALGYREVEDIVEAAARRRAGGLASGLRRLIAARRGRRLGGEIVKR